MMYRKNRLVVVSSARTRLLFGEVSSFLTFLTTEKKAQLTKSILELIILFGASQVRDKYFSFDVLNKSGGMCSGNAIDRACLCPLIPFPKCSNLSQRVCGPCLISCDDDYTNGEPVGLSCTRQ